MVIVGILDDQAKQVEYLRGVVSEFFRNKEMGYKVYSSTNSSEFMEHANDYMIVFLDVEMGVENGVDVGKSLRKTNVRTLIIYVTGHEEYRVSAEDTRLFSYLRKPVTKGKIIEILEDGLRYVDEKHKIARFETATGIISLKISDILYFEAKDRTVIAYTATQQYKINYTLAQIERIVESGFLYPHRSYLVNMKHIAGFDDNVVTMSNNTAIAIARRRMTGFRSEYIQSFWGN